MGSSSYANLKDLDRPPHRPAAGRVYLHLGARRDDPPQG